VDILRNLFGNLTSGIVRLAVAVGIIAATYFFLVKPILNQTDEVFDKAFRNTGIEDIGKTINSVNRQVQRQIRHSIRVSQQTGDTKKLIRCIQRAHQNVDKIHRCTIKY
jgi:hypothetical protein